MMVCRYLDVFANNALRRSTSTYYNLFPKDVNMLFILVGLNIAEFCCCFRCCLFVCLFLSLFCIFLSQQCAFISLSVICAIQIISATRVGNGTSKSKNIACSRLSVSEDDRKRERTTSDISFFPNRPHSSPARFFNPPLTGIRTLTENNWMSPQRPKWKGSKGRDCVNAF